jgi:hypothetical protein
MPTDEREIHGDFNGCRREYPETSLKKTGNRSLPVFENRRSFSFLYQ